MSDPTNIELAQQLLHLAAQMTDDRIIEKNGTADELMYACATALGKSAPHDPTDEDIDRVADAIDNAAHGYCIELTRLVDGVHEYTLTVKTNPREVLKFEDYIEASECMQAKNSRAKAIAAIAAMQHSEGHAQ